jgi:ATP-binding cassette, subfamily B, bacterial HlyB/CyaB
MTVGVNSALDEGAAKPADAGAPLPNEQTGIKALSAVARHLGLDWSIPRLVHVYGKEHEPNAAELVRIARAEGLKAKSYQTDWAGLERFQKLRLFWCG